MLIKHQNNQKRRKKLNLAHIKVKAIWFREGFQREFIHGMVKMKDKMDSSHVIHCHQ